MNPTILASNREEKNKPRKGRRNQKGRKRKRGCSESASKRLTVKLA